MGFTARPGRPGAAVASAGSDDRQALALLSLPVLALLLAFGLTQALKVHRREAWIAAAPAPAVMTPLAGPQIPTLGAARHPVVFGPVPPATMSAAGPGPDLRATAPSPLPLPGAGGGATSASPHDLVASFALPPPHIVPASQSAAIPASANAPLGHTPLLASRLPPLLAPLRPPQDARVANPTLAMLAPEPTQPVEIGLHAALILPLTGREMDPDPGICIAPAHVLAGLPKPSPAVPQGLRGAAFGLALAEAARAQAGEFVIYNDTYRHIAYPMGDVQPLYGVCTDVIIRAYRELGIDLQQRVHESGVGSGDSSISHRRTETLRRFFARFGRQLPPSTIGEDFLPGDIVTYNRPQNRHSRSHIAIVSGVVAASGRYMIVHNRGWGPQLEDGLFVDEITGHYRYQGEQDQKAPPPGPIAPMAMPQVGGPQVAGTKPALSSSQQRRAAATARPTGGGAIAARSAAGGAVAAHSPVASGLEPGCRSHVQPLDRRRACLRQAAAGRVRFEGAPVNGLGR